MAILIHWQAEARGPENRLTIALPGALLVVTRRGDVIVDADWQVSTALLQQDDSPAAKALQRALLEPEQLLSLQLLQQGTPYSRQVWQALTAIPLAQTLTYTQLAERLGSGPRAIAMACRNNPYPGIIPCHRVVAKSGIGGFMGQSQGAWVELKRQLLMQERHFGQNGS